MKKLLLFGSATMIAASSFAQLVDEKNVTFTMDLQPILQLNMTGPDQIDFTFDNINSYYAGITKYGANTLKVSASVSFDLWATGLAQDANYLWDNVIEYSGGGGALSVNTLPISLLELRQFPANPVTAAACALNFVNATSDYSSAFAPYDPTTNTIAAGTANNCINTVLRTTPYEAPASTAVAASTEKYISGASTAVNGCQVAAGSYLTESFGGGTPVDAGYFFIMDYRILPGLPVTFPAHEADAGAPSVSPTNNTSLSVTGPEGVDGGLGDLLGNSIYAAPGVYTMYVKYIMQEDQ